MRKKTNSTAAVAAVTTGRPAELLVRDALDGLREVKKSLTFTHTELIDVARRSLPRDAAEDHHSLLAAIVELDDADAVLTSSTDDLESLIALEGES